MRKLFLKFSVVFLALGLTSMLSLNVFGSEIDESIDATLWYEYDVNDNQQHLSSEKDKGNDKVDISTKKNNLKNEISLFTNNGEVTIVIKANKTFVLKGESYKSSLLFKNNLWLNVKESKYDIDILTIDLIKEAPEMYLMENMKDMSGETLVRLVYIDRESNKLHHVINKISNQLFHEIESISTAIKYDDLIFQEYRDAVLLNYSELIVNTPDEQDQMTMSALEISSDISFSTFSTTTITSYGSVRSELYIPSIDVTLTDWGLNYLIDSIFPSIDIIPKLIDDYSYGITKKLDDDHYQFIKEYSWINQLYPYYRNSVYMEFELFGAADGLTVRLKFADFYRYFPNTRELLYSGTSGNAWLEDFYFRFSADKPINYIKVSKVGLWEWPSFTPFDQNQATMDAIFSIGGAFTLGTVETLLEYFSDPGGYAYLNEEYQIEEHTLIYDTYNTIPFNTTEFSFVIDPKWIMRIESPSSSDTLINSRWKNLTIDIRYESEHGDIPAVEYRYIVNFKRHAVYSQTSNNQPLLDLSLVGGIIDYVIPVGC